MFMIITLSSFFFQSDGDHLDLNLLTHPFPTRRSSDLKMNSQLISYKIFQYHETPSRLRTAAHFRCHCRSRQLQPGRRGRRPLAVRGQPADEAAGRHGRSEEQTSELQSLMRISYAVFCLKKKTYY